MNDSDERTERLKHEAEKGIKSLSELFCRLGIDASVGLAEVYERVRFYVCLGAGTRPRQVRAAEEDIMLSLRTDAVQIGIDNKGLYVDVRVPMPKIGNQ